MERHKILKDALNNPETIDIAPSVMLKRMVKSKEEINLIRSGAKIADIGAKALVKEIKAGASEMDIAMVGRDAMEKALFDAADVMRFGKDLMVQHGFTTNLKGIDWLRRHFPNHRVHALNFPGDPYPIHIDATFTALKPGLIINNPNRRLPKEQRKIFEKNDWKIVDAAQPAHNKPPPLCFSSVWLSMNILVLDPKTVCVEKSEVYQAEQLSKLGMEVIEVDFRDVYPFGGGLHCSTTDVYREGKCEDYFPKQ